MCSTLAAHAATVAWRHVSIACQFPLNVTVPYLELPLRRLWSIASMAKLPRTSTAMKAIVPAHPGELLSCAKPDCEEYARARRAIARQTRADEH